MLRSCDVELTNDGADDYLLDAPRPITLPVPPHVAELMHVHGRWTREFHPIRVAVRRRRVHSPRTAAAERRTRTLRCCSPAPPASASGAARCGARTSAWSGNHALLAERLPDGRRCVQLGELLHPGEVVLEPGERYRHARGVRRPLDDGLTPASRRFHAIVRSAPSHRHRPRPVVLNTWEAVYFDHDFDTLTALADARRRGRRRALRARRRLVRRRAATTRPGSATGGSRPTPTPNGLAPLIEHVRSLGMEFGIWVEPEMVNPDSDLFRAHPEWALDDRRLRAGARPHQLVLDLAHPDAFDARSSASSTRCSATTTSPTSSGT